jgi:HAD superfamily hydrolase (TIGR01509 family)
MRPDLIIFDNDGVLVDSEILSAAIEAEVLTALGRPTTTDEAMRLFLGMTHDDMERYIRDVFGLTLPADHRETNHRLLAEAYKTRLTAIPGVADLMDRLTIPFCVASNSPPAKLGLGLTVTNLFERLYPHIFCAKLVKRGKPAPDLFLYAADRMGVSPSRTVVIEDSVAGVTGARAAGMTVIGFLGGSHHTPANAAMLRDAGAAHIAHTMAEVGALLGV